jgi:hypothetical protein
VSRQRDVDGGRNDQGDEQRDKDRNREVEVAVPASGANEELPTAYRLLPTTGHEDLAWFTRTAAELAALEAEAQARADERGPRGRRFARLRTVIEDALLQARQGVHEARHGQTERR